jgi:hypothetical protein
LAQEPQQAAVTNIINRAVPKVVGVNIEILYMGATESCGFRG